MLGEVTRYIGYPAQLSKVKFLELFLPEQILQRKYVIEIFPCLYNFISSFFLRHKNYMF